MIRGASRAMPRAHPRSRGEHFMPLLPVRCWLGSSPLARGTQRSTGERQRVVGLIPARAGNTEYQSSDHRNTRAHPRSRGEHERCAPITSSKPGSSPLARGTPTLALEWVRPSGLIPARAGNTPRHSLPEARTGAHPRSRGEHALKGSSHQGYWGSSPLARGTLAGCLSQKL